VFFNQPSNQGHSSKDTPGFVDTPEAIVERLTKTGAFQRLYGKQDRYSFRQSHCDMRIMGETSGSASRNKPITTESVTGTDICFLAPLFVYPNTRVTISLKDLLGKEHPIDCRVTKCEHAVGLHHIAMAKFEQPVRLESFVVVKDADKGIIEVDPAKFECHLLYLDDSELDAELIKHLLRKTKATVTTVTSLQAAVDFVKSGKPLDLVLCDANLAEVTGDKAITTLRANGLCVPACGITAETSPALLNNLSRVTNGMVLHKPVNAKILLSGLQTVLDKDRLDRIHSKYAGKAELQPVIAEMVRAARLNAERIAQAIGLQDAATIRTMCIRLKSSATACGFETVALAATNIVNQIDTQAELKTYEPLLQRLIDQCRRLDTAPAPKKVA
jgi:CheY-like chemotaxis protein